MKRLRRCHPVMIVAIILLAPSFGWAAPDDPAQPQPATSSEAPASSESAVLMVTGVLTAINRRAAWPRLEMEVAGGESWMLELPSTVTLAWYEGHPSELDELKPGQWIKVLYTKVGGKKRVKSVQILPGFGTGGGGGQGGGESPNALPVAPTLPPAPRLPSSLTPKLSTSLPTPPEIPTAKTPKMPVIPDIDTSRRGRY